MHILSFLLGCLSVIINKGNVSFLCYLKIFIQQGNWIKHCSLAQIANVFKKTQSKAADQDAFGELD